MWKMNHLRIASRSWCQDFSMELLSFLSCNISQNVVSVVYNCSFHLQVIYLILSSSRILQSGKKMQRSTCGKIFPLNLYALISSSLNIIYIFVISFEDIALNCVQEEFSGWREDLFTARKSSLNLLGIISISKVCIPNLHFQIPL